LETIHNAQSVDEVRGIEGSYANWYWQEFGKLIKKPEFQWYGRRKRPARDEVNALLSWGYTLLAIEIQTFCEIIGLDPYLGFMHQEYYGRPSLVCDLQEEFRPWVVDKFVLRLINLGIIRKEHFKEQNGEYRLTNEGYRIFQQEWMYKIKADKKYRVLFKTELAVRGVIETQVRLISKYIVGEHEYNAFTV